MKMHSHAGRVIGSIFSCGAALVIPTHLALAYEPICPDKEISHHLDFTGRTAPMGDVCKVDAAEYLRCRFNAACTPDGEDAHATARTNTVQQEDIRHTNPMPFVLDAGLKCSTVAIRPVADWLLVPVSIGGRDAGWFKIGTGWNTSVIDQKTAERLNLRPLSTRGFLSEPSMMPDGTAPVKFVRADELRCGGAITRMAPLSVGDLEQLSSTTQDAYGHPISGVIGWDLLSTLPFEINPENSSLTWESKGTERSGWSTTPLSTHNGYPFVKATLGNGLAVEMMVNTAGTTTVFSPRFVASHQEIMWSGPKTYPNTTFYNTLADDDKLRFPAIAGFGTTGRQVDISCFDSTQRVSCGLHPEPDRKEGGVALGMTFLGKYKILFDGPGGKLWTSPSKAGFARSMASSKEPLPMRALEYGMRSAAWNNDGEAVAELLRAGVSPDWICGSDIPLTSAVANRSRVAALALLDHGSKPSPASGSATQVMGPLLIAAMIDDLEMARLLLERGADPKIRSSGGLNALQMAATHGSPEMFSLLLKAAGMPAEPNMRLWLVTGACAGGNLAAAKSVFPKCGFDQLGGPSKREIAGMALENACLMGHPEMVEWIFSAMGQIDPDFGPSLPPLMAAIVPYGTEKTEAVRLQLVRLLLKHKAKANIENQSVTPLLLACRHGSADIVRELLAAGADVKRKDRTLRNAVQRAAEANQPPELLNLLLEAGAEFDELSSVTDLTPLATYAGHSNVEACSMLLKRGADPNKEAMDKGASLVHALSYTEASEEQQSSLCSLLIKHGAEFGGNADSKTAIGITLTTTGRLSLLQKLHGDAKVDMEKPIFNAIDMTPLMLASAIGSPATVQRILDAGGRWQTTDRLGRNAVAYAAAAGQILNLERLLAIGAKPDAPRAGAIPPLCVAVASGQLASASALLDAGADRNAVHPVSGNTPLQMAKACGDASMIRLLEK